jgi:hypothetical protein
MKHLAIASALILGAAAASQAQTTPNDLYLGFENAAGGGTADYIINLGSASSLINSTSIVDLSSYFSLTDFNSAALQGNNSSMIMGGIVGGSMGNTPSDIFVTTLQGASAPLSLTRSQDNSAYATISQIIGPAAGAGLLDSSKSWENDIEPAFSAGTFYGVTGDNPDSQVGGVLYESLWGTSNSSLTGAQPFSYEGYFTLDLTGSSPELTFTSALVPVPEPSTYMISGAGAVLLLLLRSRVWRRSA